MTTEAIDDAPDPGARARSQHRVVGSYRLLQPLGEGGMGVVHLALDRQGRAVAIKLLRPHLDADAGARSRLAREVDALRRIRSEHVAPIVDAELDGPEPFMVTRWVDGDALDEHVEAHGPLDRVALHRLAAGMAGAIEAIHAAGVVHRDVKPGNVLLQDGEPVLIDFGIAHLTDDVRLTQTGLVMGTPGYLAPEIIEGGQVTLATDWWGWAATLAYAACGRPPFGRGAMDAVLARVSRGEPDLGGVDDKLAPLLYAALSPHAADRPQAREVVSGLQRYAAGGAVTEVVALRRLAPPTSRVTVPRTAALPLPPAPRPVPALPPAAPLAPGPVRPPVATRPPVAMRPPAAASPVAGSSQAPPSVVRMAPAAAPAPPPAWTAAPGPAGLPLRQGGPGPVQHRPLVPAQPPSMRPTHTPTGAPVGPVGGPGSGAPLPVGAGQGDPRIGRPTRSGTLTAYLVLIVVAAAVFPVVTLAGVFAWLVAARLTDRTVTSLVLRRHERGRRGSDVPLAVATSPWHFVVAIVGAALTLILPLFVVGSAAFASSWALTAVQGEGALLPTFVPLAAGAFLGLVVLWWGPGGVSTRRGTRSIVRGLHPPAAVGVGIGVLGVAAIGLLAWGLLSGSPVWWPIGDPSTWAWLPALP